MLKHLAAGRHATPIAALILTALISVSSQDAVAQRGRAKPISAPGTSARSKGIWESVSYNQDLNLESVYFVTPNIGWASGAAGTIIKTVDGGAHWTPQLGGDPQGTGSTIRDLRFVDQRHGFAVQDASLLRTVDGQTWRSSGTISSRRRDYVFTSPTIGFASGGSSGGQNPGDINRTRDAGRSWQKVLDCIANVNVNGLARKVNCEIESLSFPTPQVGYGAGSAPNGVDGVFIAKTTDGGSTWAVWRVLDSESTRNGFITFTDQNKGFLCVLGGKFFSTSDGGRSWDGVAGVNCAGSGGRGKFADPETGWMLENRRWTYTTNGGSSWGSRAMTFPAGVNEFSLPRRDRGYVVGEHGMVYRYSIVSVEHTAPNSIDAPVVGAFTSPLDDQVEQLISEVTNFVAENDTLLVGTNRGMDTARAAGGSDNGSGGTSAAAENRGDNSASGASLDPGTGSAATGSAGARRKAKRGGANGLGKLQALLDVIGTSMPDFLGRYRNLNLLFEGARTAAGLPSWLQTVKGHLAALRSSTDKNSAAAALAQLVSAADSLKNQTRVAFLRASFTPGPGDAAAGASSTPDPVGVSAAAPEGVRVDSAAARGKSGVADSIASAAKQAAKKKLGGFLKNPFGKP